MSDNVMGKINKKLPKLFGEHFSISNDNIAVISYLLTLSIGSIKTGEFIKIDKYVHYFIIHSDHIVVQYLTGGIFIYKIDNLNLITESVWANDVNKHKIIYFDDDMLVIEDNRAEDYRVIDRHESSVTTVKDFDKKSVKFNHVYDDITYDISSATGYRLLPVDKISKSKHNPTNYRDEVIYRGYINKLLMKNDKGTIDKYRVCDDKIYTLEKRTLVIIDDRRFNFPDVILDVLDFEITDTKLFVLLLRSNGTYGLLTYEANMNGHSPSYVYNFDVKYTDQKIIKVIYSDVVIESKSLNHKFVIDYSSETKVKYESERHAIKKYDMRYTGTHHRLLRKVLIKRVYAKDYRD